MGWVGKNVAAQWRAARTARTCQRRAPPAFAPVVLLVGFWFSLMRKQLLHGRDDSAIAARISGPRKCPRIPRFDAKGDVICRAHAYEHLVGQHDGPSERTG